MKYFVLENIEGDPINKRVIVIDSIAEAYRVWLDSPINRTVVKEIKLEVIEK